MFVAIASVVLFISLAIWFLSQLMPVVAGLLVAAFVAGLISAIVLAVAGIVALVK